MAPRSGYDYAKLEALASQQKIIPIGPLTKLRQLAEKDVPNFVTPTDEQRAEQCLLEGRSSKLIRKPTFRTKAKLELYEAKNISAALPALIAANEGAGVIQALLNRESKFASIKDDGKKQIQLDERDSLLLRAVETSNEGVVWLLAPRTSLMRRNESLTVALATRNSAIIKKLLEYGADPNHCSHQFTTAAASGDVFVIEHLLSAPVELRPALLLDTLKPAVLSGSLQTLQRIVGTADLHGVQEIEAVREAAHRGWVDPLITVLIRANSIGSDYLDQLVFDVFRNTEINTKTLQIVLQALFYAGAAGSKCSAAMRLAVERQSMDLVRIFAENKVDVNWGRGCIVSSAVKTGRSDLLRQVLSSGSISNDNASLAVEALPRNLSAQARFDMLEILVNAGAYGEPVEQELVLAVQNNNEMLVCFLRKKGVSVDNRQGEALIAAIQTENNRMLEGLLDGPVAQSSLQNALPQVRCAGKTSRLQMTELLIKAKVEGVAVDVALRDAVCDESANRDQSLIDVLLQANGDPAYSDAQSMRYAIYNHDTALFEKILACPAGVSEGVVSSLVSDVMAVKDRNARLRLMSCILLSHPKEQYVASALLDVVSERDIDLPLLKLIARSGQVNINHRDGAILMRATLHPELAAVTELIKISGRSQGATTNALIKVLEQQDLNDEVKATRATILLSSGRTSLPATQGLLSYVKYCKGSGLNGRDWPMRTFHVLLTAGADINFSPDILPDVTRSAAVALLQALLAEGPRPSIPILDAALHEVVRLKEVSRMNILRIILEAGPSQVGISRALIQATAEALDEECSMLLQQGGSLELDEFAAIRHAVSSGQASLLDIFLRRKLTQDAVVAAFEQAKLISANKWKYESMQAILDVGVPRTLLSEYLVQVVQQEHHENIVQLLLSYQADVHYSQNKALVLTATRGDPVVLQMLFSSATEKQSSATQCFEHCVGKNLIREEYIAVLESLLEAGAHGHSLDIALQQAVNSLPSQPKLSKLLESLVACGANINDNDGQALCHACETASSEVVSILLQGNPSRMTKSRALHFLLRSNVADSEFCKILDLLMDAERSLDGEPSLDDAQKEFGNPLQTLLQSRPNGHAELEQVLKYDRQILLQKENEGILIWAMAQKKSQIHNQCIGLLISKGANLHCKDFKSGDSVLLLAILNGRTELIKTILAYGADVSIANNEGTTPLLLASSLGDQVATANLLEMGVPKNDGSLHQAARKLNYPVVEVLLKHGHSPNYPSPQGQGRTPLAELLYAAMANRQNLGLVERTIGILKHHGAETRKPISRKPLICWALDNRHDPVFMVQALLAAYLFEDIDADFNLYTNDRICYSPTMYVAKGQFSGGQKKADELITLLRNWGANRDVYYSLTGPQPEDAVGMPEDLGRLEAIRRAKIAIRHEEEQELARRRQIEEEEYIRRRRLSEEELERRKRREEEEIERQIAYRRRLEAEDQRVLRQKHEMSIMLSAEAEAAKQRELHARHTLQMSMQREIGENERRSLLDRIGLQQKERKDELGHRTALNNLELEKTRERLLLESQSQASTATAAQSALEAQVKVQKQLMSSQDHHNERMHTRRMKELAMAKAIPVGLVASPSGGGFIEN